MKLLVNDEYRIPTSLIDIQQQQLNTLTELKWNYLTEKQFMRLERLYNSEAIRTITFKKPIDMEGMILIDVLKYLFEAKQELLTQKRPKLEIVYNSFDHESSSMRILRANMRNYNKRLAIQAQHRNTRHPNKRGR